MLTEFGIINLPQSGLNLNAMTPKEKARELVHKYYIYSLKGKECALIAVDEILHDMIIRLGLDKEDFEYWREVKEEIDNL